MATVFIANMAVTLPSRFSEGDIASHNAAMMLNEIQHRRVKARLRYLLERNEIAPFEVQAKADELCAMDLVPHLTSDDEENSDPVFEEAMLIARELIVARMAKEGLPPPKGLDMHAKALVDAMPEIHERARLRVEARYMAASQSLGEV